MTEDILKKIAAKTRERVAADKERTSPSAMRERAEKAASHARDAQRFRRALEGSELSFICEVKKASPSKGVISQDFPYREIARSYDASGAAAISCLTEPHWFLGSDVYLEEIASDVRIPVLRKDFVVDEYMVYQAKALGADAVLLICSLLDDARLRAYGDLAAELGMAALVEAHDEAEVERALASGAGIVGVNNRDLRDFSVDFGNAARLRAAIPAGVLFVAESGIKAEADVEAVSATGADAVLVGEALMRSGDIAATLASFREAAERGRHG